MSNGTILLVDDDCEMVDSFSNWFRRKGYATTPTYHPMQCLMAAATKKYDVALVDIGMPDMNGLEVVAELVQLESFPVIVLSGSNDKECESEALRLGAMQYISKPAKMEQIEAAIQNAMARNITATRTLRCMNGSLLSGSTSDGQP